MQIYLSEEQDCSCSKEMMWHALNSFFFLICNALSMPVLGPITRSLPPPLTKKESPSSSVESLIITINNTNININITIMTTNKTRWWTFVQSCGLSSCLWRPAFQISETLWAPLGIAWIRCSHQATNGYNGNDDTCGDVIGKSWSGWCAPQVTLVYPPQHTSLTGFTDFLAACGRLPA